MNEVFLNVEDRLANEVHRQTIERHFAGVSDEALIARMLATRKQIDAIVAERGPSDLEGIDLVIESNWMFDALHLRGIYEQYREVRDEA